MDGGGHRTCSSSLITWAAAALAGGGASAKIPECVLGASAKFSLSSLICRPSSVS